MIKNGWDGDYLELGKERTSIDKKRAQDNCDIICFHRTDDPEKIKDIKILKMHGKKDLDLKELKTITDSLVDNINKNKLKNLKPHETIKDIIFMSGDFLFEQFKLHLPTLKPKKIVVDNDDTTLIEEIGTLSKFMEYQGLVHKGFELADMVTCSTDFLAEEYKKYTDSPVVVLPNCVNPDDFPTNLVKNQGEKIRIGLIGSVLYKEDRSVIENLLRELDKDDRVQLVGYGMVAKEDRNSTNVKSCEIMKEDLEFWDSLENFEWHSWNNIDKYLSTLNSLALDFMIISRKDNYFNRCKSNLKFLEASMLEIPTICQRFDDNNSPYDKDIMQGFNGYLATDEEDWKNKIEFAIRHKDKMTEIGKNAKKYVLDKYDINNNYKLWEEAYKKIK
jgi:hypothetical protein